MPAKLPKSLVLAYLASVFGRVSQPAHVAYLKCVATHTQHLLASASIASFGLNSAPSVLLAVFLMQTRMSLAPLSPYILDV
jgi:hypothetical protein